VALRKPVKYGRVALEAENESASHRRQPGESRCRTHAPCAANPWACNCRCEASGGARCAATKNLIADIDPATAGDRGDTEPKSRRARRREGPQTHAGPPCQTTAVAPTGRAAGETRTRPECPEGVPNTGVIWRMNPRPASTCCSRSPSVTRRLSCIPPRTARMPHRTLCRLHAYRRAYGTPFRSPDTRRERPSPSPGDMKISRSRASPASRRC
jgi:hypothetical protein